MEVSRKCFIFHSKAKQGTFTFTALIFKGNGTYILSPELKFFIINLTNQKGEPFINLSLILRNAN